MWFPDDLENQILKASAHIPSSHWDACTGESFSRSGVSVLFLFWVKQLWDALYEDAVQK